MTRTFFSLTVFLVAATLLTSCTETSAVYNTSLALPGTPMRSGAIQITGGGTMLPEARPQFTNRQFELGAQSILRAGITDNIALSFNGWRSLTSRVEDGAQWGWSGAAIISYNVSEDLPVAIIPSLQFTYADQYLRGEGGAIWFACWPTSNRRVSTYLAAAPFYGRAEASSEMYGYGGIANLGSVFHLTQGLDLTLELGGVYQFNQYDRISSLVPTPSVSVAYTIR